MGRSNQIEILNLAAALDRLGGDSELLGEIAKLFLDSVPEMLARVRDAVACGDARGLERAAHALKGSLGNFSAEAALEAAFRLERMGGTGELVGMEEACQALEREIERLRPALAALEQKSG